MIDPVLTDLDSLRNQQETFGVENDVKLYEQLFDYGARLNRNLIIDPQCAPILLDAGPMGNQRNMQLFNWYFAPLAMPLELGIPSPTIWIPFISILCRPSIWSTLRRMLPQRCF